MVELAWGGGKGSESRVAQECSQDGGFRVRFCWGRTWGFRHDWPCPPSRWQRLCRWSKRPAPSWEQPSVAIVSFREMS